MQDFSLFLLKNWLPVGLSAIAFFGIGGEDVSQVSRSDRWKARRVEVSLAPLEPEGEESSE